MVATTIIRVEQQVHTRLLAMKHKLETRRRRFVSMGETVKELLNQHDGQKEED